MTSFKQVPLTCGGHTRPVVHLAFSDVTKDGFYLISACKGEFLQLFPLRGCLNPWHVCRWKSCKCVRVFSLVLYRARCVSFGGLHFPCLQHRSCLHCILCAPVDVTLSSGFVRKHLEFPLVYFLRACSPWRRLVFMHHRRILSRSLYSNCCMYWS